MQPLSFIASSAEEAVIQIRHALGPNAVVLNVRPLPANGIARLWQKPMIEVLAHLPEAPAVPAPTAEEFIPELNQQIPEPPKPVSTQAPNVSTYLKQAAAAETSQSVSDDDAPVDSGQWRVGTVLQRTGMSALHAQGITDQLRAQHGEMPPVSLAEEMALARKSLTNRWRKARAVTPKSLHVLVGPAGSGKTTCLCKWLTQTALVESRLARVWRLDGATANMAESLSVYCDILGVASERTL